MDAVELARQVAAALHETAINSGSDPWKPYEFALAEAGRRDIVVETTSPGSPLLENGRAIYRPAEQLIIHEKAGTLFEQAFLVAHELGHAALGDGGESPPAKHVDLSRPAEASPMGIDRVVDYNENQRREVQMDLFAREFLLPRALVRRLHLEENLSPTEIAGKCGAPFEVVAQQLLDALLLPTILPEEENEQVNRPPNASQINAIDHRGLPYLLEAGPGTGKTQTLSGRVRSLLTEGVDPRRILVLTFSNRAAREMGARIALMDKEAAAAMWIGTFHAFGLDLIRRFHEKLNLPKDPRMMDRTEAVELLEEEFPRLALRHYKNLYDPTQIIGDLLTAISRAKDEVVDAKKYRELADAMLKGACPDGIEAAERSVEVSIVYEAYEAIKAKAGSIDFGDLISLPVLLLESDDSVRKLIQESYDHVLVDEYQDVNRSSVRLLAAIRPRGENLWSVGDPKQSIYRFRGASSFSTKRFGKEDFPGGVRGRLEQNYRSVSEVVDLFSAFSVSMKGADSVGYLTSDRGSSGNKPELRTVSRAGEQAVAIADAIEEARTSGHSYRNQAVLCTGNEKLSEVAEDLERLGVPVLFLGSLFERPEVKELFSLLTILTDRRAMGLVRVAAMTEFRIPFEDVGIVLDGLQKTDSEPGSWLQRIDQISGISENGRTALKKVAATLSGFNKLSPPWRVIAEVILERTRVASEIALSKSVGVRAKGIAIWQLMNFLRTQPSGSGLPITRLLNRVRRLLRLGDDKDLRQLPAAAQQLDAVRLMTVHGAKGLEFSVVHLPGLNADTLPRAAQAPKCLPPIGMIEGASGSPLNTFKEGHAEEQECIFFVAVSRARDRLIIYAVREKDNGTKRALSPFLDRVMPHLSPQHISPSRILIPPAEAADIKVFFEGNLRFSAHQIGLYETCPRRFFYTHVLQVGGCRTTTAFMQMHEAVRKVVESVISSGGTLEKEADLDLCIEEEFSKLGLTAHGYATHYRSFAKSMVQYFVKGRVGLKAEPPVALRLLLGTEEIIVKPDEVLVTPDGKRRFRRIRTGHERADEQEDVGAAAFMMAAQEAFPDAVIELVYLSDEKAKPLGLSDKQLQNRRTKLTQYFGDIRLGRFRANPSTRLCSGCPAFFICGPTPIGTFRKKF